MNRYDYDLVMAEIRLLETKLKRIHIEKEHHSRTKPSIFSSQEKIENWKQKNYNLLEEENITFESLHKAYMEIEKFLPSKKK